MINRIVLISPCSGTGKTTLTANLAAALLLAGGAGGQGVLTVGFDPGNDLRRYSCDPQSPLPGLLRATLQGNAWLQAVSRSPSGVDRLDFGAYEYSERQSFESRLRNNPALLHDHLMGMNHGLTLIDTSAGTGPYFWQAIHTATLILVVLETGSEALTGMVGMQACLAQFHAIAPIWPTVHYVLNRTDWRDPSTRAVVQAVRQQVGRSGLLWQIHEDSKLQKACAGGYPVVTHDPEATSAADIRSMAAWIRTLI